MFYAPKTVASMVAALSPAELESEREFYSDFHKDAIGCRPRKPLPECPVEAAVEVKRLAEWMAEGERIEKMAHEVARFRFSRSLEYLVRRGDAVGRCDALRILVEREDSHFFDGQGQDWDYICYKMGLPYEDAPKLKQLWEVGV
jgi:hypothetical protein